MTAKETEIKPRNNSESDGEASSLELEMRSNILKIADIEKAHKAKRTTGERIAEAVAGFCGSMHFVLMNITLFGSWIILNLTFLDLDPFPFTFLTLAVSLEAIFLSTFILISQNQEKRHTERRNHLDLQINMLAEQEATKTLELIHLIAEKVGVSADKLDSEALLEPVEPERLVEQIMSAVEESEKETPESTNKE